jgi:hypothetical protein
MSKGHNKLTGANRSSEVGLCYKEIITNGQGSKEIPIMSALRIRSTGVATVKLDGELSATLSAGEIIIVNSGLTTSTTKATVTLLIEGANCFVQLGKEV